MSQKAWRSHLITSELFTCWKFLKNIWKKHGANWWAAAVSGFQSEILKSQPQWSLTTPIYFSVCLVFSCPHSFYSWRKEFAIDYWTEKHTNIHKSRTRQEITRKRQSFSERISNRHVGQPVFSLFASGIKLCINRQQTKGPCHKRLQRCTLLRCLCVCTRMCVCLCAPACVSVHQMVT